ncbi:LmeA family phospholipid-binding protein [Streptomyces yokosukanensis]|uniref:LmeA family phospholipid-binding protein n=1 Tax=Streptomyces yokosukanensis TaxID=67386 RepID=UPI0034347A1E
MKLRRTPVIIATALAAAGATTAGISDILVTGTAQQRIALAVRHKLHPSGAVTVRLTGSLAGPDTLTGTFGTVRVIADGIQHAGLRLSNIVATLHGVTTHGTTTGGSASATVPYTALSRHLDAAAALMTMGTDGTDLTLTTTAGSSGLPLTVTARITTAHSITLTPTTVSFLGRALPVSAVADTPGGAGLASGFTPHTVALAGLPAGARLTSARPDHTGLALQLTIPATGKLVALPGGPGDAGCTATAQA